MSNLVYIFLDIDGVLNSFQYLEYCYKRHHKPMSMNHTPFDPNCLENLMILVQTIERNDCIVQIILSSTWRLSEIDYEIVNARLAEYGLRLEDKTPNIDSNRGLEISQFLKDKQYNNILILDDEGRDILSYYPNNLISCNPVNGFSKENIQECFTILDIRGDEDGR